MQGAAWIKSHFISAISFPVIKLSLSTGSRQFALSACKLKMGDQNSLPAGAIKLNPLNIKSAFGESKSCKGDICPTESVKQLDPKDSSAAGVPINKNKKYMALTEHTEGGVGRRDVSEIAKRSKQDLKGTVLPQGLLREVTELVKHKFVSVPSSNVSSTTDIDSSLLSDDVDASTLSTLKVGKQDSAGKHTVAMEDLEESEISTTGNKPDDQHLEPQQSDQENLKITECVTKVTSSVASTTDAKPMVMSTEYVDIELDISVGGEQVAEDAFEGLELDETDEAVKNKVPYDESQILPDIAALFSGELERRRKKQLKKAKLKAWKQGKHKKRQKESKGEDSKDKEKDTSETLSKPSANYFVAVQISNPEISEALRHVQEKAVSVCPDLSQAMNRPATFHLTMFVLSINNEEEMNRSKLALDEVQKRLQPQFSEVPLLLDIAGLGHFRNEVVFAKVRGDDQVSQLEQIADMVEDSFLEQQIVSPDKKGFKPHLTIMKLSYLKGKKRKGLKKIDANLYKEDMDTEFGTQHCDSLQLCSMHKKKQETGYYHVDHTIQFAASADGLQTQTDNNPAPVGGSSSTEVVQDNIQTDTEVECKQEESHGKENSDDNIIMDGQTKSTRFEVSDTNATCTLDLNEGSNESECLKDSSTCNRGSIRKDENEDVMFDCYEEEK